MQDSGRSGFKRLHIEMRPDMAEEVDKIAERLGISKAEFTRRCLRIGLYMAEYERTTGKYISQLGRITSDFETPYPMSSPGRGSH